jgi:hypothetical protein
MQGVCNLVAGSVQREGCGSFENSNIRKREMIQVELKNYAHPTPKYEDPGRLKCG